ncbi:sugar ABC transporter ATP-binding protein [Xylanimonas oleitrophica]|uniref:sugar ABC transporter ATP-binding protein n=1 Tax=Xylanimonas oleitrophica TaxID=2607479 RepID=UPI0015CF93D3|nr:sugar ABC transporter ATP-binding protein [Xylanimonas oleitrophica]
MSQKTHGTRPGERREALTCTHVSKSFGPTRAVADVDFHLDAGEVLALVGENGAGKSTLMNMLSGGLAPDTGEITVAEPTGELGRRVAMVHQELSLFANLTVAENLALDHAEPASEPESRARARAVLDRLGVDIDEDATVGDLSVGQRQLVEIAKAITVAPVLLILDEPTSSLEGPQVELLFRAVRRLAAAGTAVVFVSHRMDELFELCDRVLVMRDGAQVDFGDLATRTRADLVASMVGRETTSFYPDRAAPDAVRAADEATAAVELDGVSVAGRLHDVSVSFPAGVITAVAGLEGHGQSDLAEVVAGVRRPDHGTVRRSGRAVRFATPRAAVRAGIGYVAPDRRLDGLLLDQSITANAMLAAAPRIFRSGFVSARKERATVLGVVQTLAVRCASVLQPVVELSGGNQQKVLVGRWLIDDDLQVLVLNDPTRGVDVGSRAQIYDVVRALADRGVAVLLVSTDLQEILGLADQVYVMYAGRVTGRLPADGATEQSVMHLATGGNDHV